MRHLLLLGLLALPLAATAQETAEKTALQAAFASRQAKIDTAKAGGSLGETTAGILAVPNGGTAEAAVADLMAQENADRQKLYQLLAAETGATPAVVAERNARRIYQAAAPGTWLQKKDGSWAKK